MAGQLRTIRVGTNTDGAYPTPLGLVSETGATLSADPSVGGSGAAGIVLGGGLAPIGGIAHGSTAAALGGRNAPTGLYASDIVYTGTYLNGIVLSDPATQNPATVAATGYVANLTTNHIWRAI